MMRVPCRLVASGFVVGLFFLLAQCASSHVTERKLELQKIAGFEPLAQVTDEVRDDCSPLKLLLGDELIYFVAAITRLR